MQRIHERSAVGKGIVFTYCARCSKQEADHILDENERNVWTVLHCQTPERTEAKMASSNCSHVTRSSHNNCFAHDIRYLIYLTHKSIGEHQAHEFVNSKYYFLLYNFLFILKNIFFPLLSKLIFLGSIPTQST